MATRELDNSRDPVTEWPFMSVHNWGEDPRGVWTVEVIVNILLRCCKSRTFFPQNLMYNLCNDFMSFK